MNEPPQFGLLDVIEAFTAMRHEYRNQTKESREVAASLSSASAKIDQFADQIQLAITKLATAATASEAPPIATNADKSQKQVAEFAAALAEIEHQVSRSVEATARSLAALSPAGPAANSGTDAAPPPLSASQQLSSLGPLARFFCRGFAAQIDRNWEQERLHRDQQWQATIRAVVSGLNMTADHLRRRITAHGIERIDVLGEPFDGNRMRAVEVVESDEVAPGHVAEQLSPAYRFDGRIIQYADVRISRPQ